MLALALALATGISGCATFASEIPAHEVRVLTDPAGDDYGPGSYVYPESDVYRPGALDVRGLRLMKQEEDLVIEVSFNGQVPVAKGVRLAREHVDDLVIATVDIYMDLDGRIGSGVREALPGRRARLGERAGWELAVVLSPIPSRLKEALSDYVESGKVLVPRHVLRRAKTLRARVPWDRLEGARLEDIGLALAVTGTVFGSTFKGAVEGMLPSAYVREVTPELGRCQRYEEDWDGAPCTFGGCGECQGHPRVIDALAPEPGVQERALGRWRDPASGIAGSADRAAGLLSRATGESGRGGSWTGRGYL